MRFESEEAFEEFYAALASPADHLRELAEWRRFQIKIVSKFIDQIRLIADEQYSDLDHFLLELLQNADDNDYPAGVTPKVVVRLTRDELTLDNNESGFNAGNLYAITYAAASTKIRRKSAATYIGEKGIGFKSVFAVADFVEIHSGPYHFRLNNGEFIVPHPVPEEKVVGTRIKLRFKSGGDDLAGILSERLARIGNGPREFTMFLTKLRILEIHDQLTGRVQLIESGADKAADGFWNIDCDGLRARYYRRGYMRVIPAEVVETRFRDIKEDLPRQIDLAVPVPGTGDAKGAGEGHLFCFLPTHVVTGCPVYIQADAKTTTNRENIQNFSASPWNRCLFDGLAQNLIDFYCHLTTVVQFRRDLPTYWPVGIEERNVGNEDLREVLLEVEQDLGNHPIVLDRHGQFRTAAQVRMLPTGFSQWLYDDACEDALSSALGGSITFVDRDWQERHAEILESVGVMRVAPLELFAAMDCDFAGRTLGADEKKQRAFLQDLMNLAADYRVKYRAAELKPLPIFPVLVSGRPEWSGLADNVVWVQSDSPRVTVSGDTSLVDPTFTYSPGGSATRTPDGEAVRQLNSNFRHFLSQTLHVPHHDELYLLRQTVVRELQSLSVDIGKRAARQKVNQDWAKLFSRVWKRRKTVIKELGQDAFDKFIVDLGKCLLPAIELPKKSWQLVEASACFLGKPFHPDGALEKVYAGTGASFVRLDCLDERSNAKPSKRASSGTDWAEWSLFFEAIGLHRGPYLTSANLSSFLRSSQRVGSENTTCLGLKSALDRAVCAHSEFSVAGTEWYTIKGSAKTVGIDRFSLAALRLDQGHAFIGAQISAVWQNVSEYKTELSFTWGHKRDARSAKTPALLLFDQLRQNLRLGSTMGLHPPASCFVASAFNQKVLGRVAPLVHQGAQGYSSSMLRELGVRGDATLDDLKALIESWAARGLGGEDFGPMLEAVGNFLEAHPGSAVQAKYQLKFFDSNVGALRPISEWLNSDAPTRFEAAIVDRIRYFLGKKRDEDAPTLVARLFEIGDLRLNREAFGDALADLGRRVSMEGGCQGLDSFESKLAEIGILCGSERAVCRQDLPVIWDVLPLPSDETNYLVIKVDATQRADVSEALRSLGWTCLSGLAVELVGPLEWRASNPVSARTMSVAVKELIKRVSADAPGLVTRLRVIPLLAKLDSIGSRVRHVDDLQIRIDVGSSAHKVSVPYWPKGDCLYVDSNAPIEDALPQYIDGLTGATTAAFSDLVWSWARDHSNAIPGRDGESPLQRREGEEGHSSDCDPASHASNALLKASRSQGMSGEELVASPMNVASAGDAQGNTKPNDGPRRRLCSYVVHDATAGKDDSQPSGSASSARNKEVEQAGRHRMLSYFKARGIQVVSREKDNVGYDFEAIVGARTIYIELKASRDTWAGWEHALSRNEFIQAFAKRENYYLCAVDRALSDESKIYFIADPAGLVDQYVFDDPWRHFSVDMDSHLKQLMRGDDSEEV